MIISCFRCGKNFNRKPSEVANRNYCSNKCKRKPIIKKSCENCGGEFTVSVKSKRFCSWKCAGYWVGKQGHLRIKGKLNHYTCSQCEQKFPSYYKKRKFCSKLCMSLYRTGKPFFRYQCSSKDKNHNKIISVFESVGAQILDFSHMGRGIPDLMVAVDSFNLLVEIKNPENYYGRAGLNFLQQKWASKWQAPVYVIKTEEEAKDLVQRAKQALLYMTERGIDLNFVGSREKIYQPGLVA